MISNVLSHKTTSRSEMIVIKCAVNSILRSKKIAMNCEVLKYNFMVDMSSLKNTFSLSGVPLKKSFSLSGVPLKKSFSIICMKMEKKKRKENVFKILFSVMKQVSPVWPCVFWEKS